MKKCQGKLKGDDGSTRRPLDMPLYRGASFALRGVYREAFILYNRETPLPGGQHVSAALIVLMMTLHGKVSAAGTTSMGTFAARAAP